MTERPPSGSEGRARVRLAALSTARWLPVTVLLGMCPGLALWQLLHMPQLRGIARNEIAEPGAVLVYVAISALATLGAYAAAYGFTRRADLRAADLFVRLNRYVALVALAPIYFYLRSLTMGSEHAVFSMLACTAAGAIAASFVYTLSRKGRETSRDAGAGARRAALAAVLILASVYAAAIARFEWIHHENLGTRAWDFGLYINSMWRSVHGDPLGCSLLSAGTHAYRHFDPILILISPVLLIYPDAQALIGFQAIWAASGAIPLYLLCAQQLRNPWYGAALAAGYLLHPALHGPNIYDFHSLFLAGPLVLWCMYFLETGRTKRFFAALVLLMLCREELPVLALLMGVYALVSGKPRHVGWGAIAAAAVYGVTIYLAIVSRVASYANYFDDIKEPHRSVASSIVLALLTNPAYVLRYALSEEKIVYILKLVVPLLFLPLFSGKKRILFLLGFGVTLLGSKGCFFSISMQYSTWWLPFMWASVPTAIDRVAGGRAAGFLGLRERPLRGALVAGVLVCTLAMSATYGILWPNRSFRAGYEEFVRTPTADMLARAATVEKIRGMIPAGASVMTTKHLCPHFAARDDIWIIDTPKIYKRPPDYVVLWPREMEDRYTSDNERRIQRDNVRILEEPGAYALVLRENDISLYRHR